MADGVQSLNRALGILETLACSSHGLGILELSQRVKLPASTTHRLLSTLGRKGYVTQLHDVFRDHAAPVVDFIEAFQPLVAY